MAQSTRDILARAYGSADAARAWLLFYAGCHDVGKISPGFASQGWPEMREHLYDATRYDADGEVSNCGPMRHERISAATVRTFLINQGMKPQHACVIIQPIAGHHRHFVTDSDMEQTLVALTAHDSIWGMDRYQHVSAMALCAGLTKGMIAGYTGSSAESVTLMAGFVVLADWLASTESAFPMIGNDVVDMEQRMREGVTATISQYQWEPTNDHNIIVKHVGLVPGSVNPTQRAVMNVVKDQGHCPQLLFVEAPTGSGKTEAALMAAERIAAHTGARGVSMYVPTTTTTHATYERFSAWAASLSADAPSRVHTQAYMYDAQRKPVHKVAEFLYPFHLATVDHLLRMVVRAPLSPVRHAGLAGRVVIIDEVHSFDDYMMNHLRRVLRLCAHLRVSVIVTSTTLSPQVRDMCMRAFIEGLEGSPNTSTIDVAISSKAYPVVIHVNKDRVKTRVPRLQGQTAPCAISWCSEDDLAHRVARTVRSGGVVFVVRNTVASAITTARRIADLTTAPVLLNHTRFSLSDRVQRDRALLDWCGVGGERPNRLVVVGTQVIEQSLDIDADIIFSDLAPVDRIIQCAGRCHRHVRVCPKHLRQRRMVLIGQRGKMSTDVGSRYMYGSWHMIVAARVLSQCSSFDIADVPALIHEAEAMKVAQMPEDWQAVAAAACNEQEQRVAVANHHARPWWGPSPDDDGEEIVRWSEGYGKDRATETAVISHVCDVVPAVTVGVVGYALAARSDRSVLFVNTQPDDIGDVLLRAPVRPSENASLSQMSDSVTVPLSWVEGMKIMDGGKIRLLRAYGHTVFTYDPAIGLVRTLLDEHI